MLDKFAPPQWSKVNSYSYQVHVSKLEGICKRLYYAKCKCNYILQWFLLVNVLRFVKHILLVLMNWNDENQVKIKIV